MARYAIDASTVLATVLNEAHTAVARHFFASLISYDELIGPAILLTECTSNLREEVFHNRISERRARDALQGLLRLPITQRLDHGQHELAFRIAGQLSMRKAYDAHYIAVASLTQAELVTIDGGMYQGAVNFKVPARLLR